MREAQAKAGSRAGSRLAVIVPARNEAGNLPAVLADIRAHLPGAAVVVVDDHSQDGTASAASAFPGVTVLRAPIPLGVGGAVQLGIRYGLERGFDLFLRMDGDGQHRAEHLTGLMDSWAPGTLVQGARDADGFETSSSRLRLAGSHYFRWLFRACARHDVRDPTSGLMCFGRDIARKFNRFYPSDFPEIESIVLLARSGHRIVSHPVIMEPRREGKSSIGALGSLLYAFTVTLAFFSAFIRTNPYRAPHAA